MIARLLIAFMLSFFLAWEASAVNYTVTSPTPNYSTNPLTQAADCSATNGSFRQLCHETADDTLWFCEVETGCAAANWVQVGGATGAGGATVFNVSWAAASTSDDWYVKADAALTLTALNCTATGATTPSAFIITVDECDANGTTCVSSGGTVTLGALVTNTADSTFTDAAIDSGDWIRFDITSLTTAPDYAHCTLTYTR